MSFLNCEGHGTDDPGLPLGPQEHNTDQGDIELRCFTVSSAFKLFIFAAFNPFSYIVIQ